jgi:hypothetical protein
MEVKIRPKPNPASKDPTNARGDAFRKKNPTPKPKSKPPPVAQSLLSSFDFIIIIYSAYYLKLLYRLIFYELELMSY